MSGLSGLREPKLTLSRRSELVLSISKSKGIAPAPARTCACECDMEMKEMKDRAASTMSCETGSGSQQDRLLDSPSVASLLTTRRKSDIRPPWLRFAPIAVRTSGSRERDLMQPSRAAMAAVCVVSGIEEPNSSEIWVMRSGS